MFYTEIGFVYSITCIVNNKVYIGETSNLYTRFKTHVLNPINKFLAEDLKKYGIENFEFEVLDVCLNTKERKQKETIYINSYRAFDRNHGYNIHKSHVARKLYLKKLTRSEVALKSWMLSKSEKRKRLKNLRTRKYKHKISQIVTNKWLDPEYKEKMRLAAKAGWEKRKSVLLKKK